MKLSIDTSMDSKDDLKKVIQLLKMIVGDDVHTTNLAESPLPSTDVSGLMSLFDQTPAQPQPAPNTPALGAPTPREELTDPTSLPQIEFY